MAFEARRINTENLKIPITVRIPLDLHRELMEESDPRKRDQSEIYLTLILDGKRVRQIKKMASNPERKLEFEKKLGLLIEDVRDEHTLQTMDTAELDSLIFLATQVKESKIKQLLLKYPQ